MTCYWQFSWRLLLDSLSLSLTGYSTWWMYWHVTGSSCDAFSLSLSLSLSQDILRAECIDMLLAVLLTPSLSLSLSQEWWMYWHVTGSSRDAFSLSLSLSLSHSQDILRAEYIDMLLAVLLTPSLCLFLSQDILRFSRLTGPEDFQLHRTRWR